MKELFQPEQYLKELFGDESPEVIHDQEKLNFSSKKIINDYMNQSVRDHLKMTKK